MIDLTPPAHLPDSIATAYKGVVDVLTESGVIGSIQSADLYLIETLAVQLVRMREAQQEIEDRGAYYMVGTNGAWAKHPAVTTEQQACDRIIKLSSKLGLSPEDRSKLAMLDTHTSDDDLAL